MASMADGVPSRSAPRSPDALVPACSSSEPLSFHFPSTVRRWMSRSQLTQLSLGTGFPTRRPLPHYCTLHLSPMPLPCLRARARAFDLHPARSVHPTPIRRHRPLIEVLWDRAPGA